MNKAQSPPNQVLVPPLLHLSTLIDGLLRRHWSMTSHVCSRR
jgi:hypothetical protein